MPTKKKNPKQKTLLRGDQLRAELVILQCVSVIAAGKFASNAHKSHDAVISETFELIDRFMDAIEERMNN